MEVSQEFYRVIVFASYVFLCFFGSLFVLVPLSRIGPKGKLGIAVMTLALLVVWTIGIFLADEVATKILDILSECGLVQTY